MTASLQPAPPGLLERLRNAGVEPSDSQALRLNKQLLFFATGLASRIASEGMPGAIHCDAATRQRLAASFEFAAPQRINLKGKGEMTVYRPLGRKNASRSKSGGDWQWRGQRTCRRSGEPQGIRNRRIQACRL